MLAGAQASLDYLQDLGGLRPGRAPLRQGRASGDRGRAAGGVRQGPTRAGRAAQRGAVPPAYALGQLVGAGLLDHAAARGELVSAGGFLIGADCGCTATEITRVIDSGLTAGAANPRRTTPRTSPTSTGRDAA